jgi:DNA-binding response OmpR family regulator
MRGTVPDVVLLDMMMPGMTGQQTLERMREIPALSGVPVIIMSARSDCGVVGQLQRLAAAVIAKPFDPATLADRIRAALR